MSLNDDALSDLENENVVKQPGDGPGVNSDGDSIVVITSDTPTDEDEAARKAIADINENQVKLASVEENQVKLRSMNDVVDTLVAAESICRTDLTRIVAAFEDVTNVVASAGEFTEVPSKVNYTETLRYAKQQTAILENSVEAEFKQYFASTSTAIKVVIEDILKRVGPSTLDSLYRIQECASEQVVTIMRSKAFLYYDSSRELRDIRLVDFGHMANMDPARERVIEGPNAENHVNYLKAFFAICPPREACGVLSNVNREKGFAIAANYANRSDVNFTDLGYMAKNFDDRGREYPMSTPSDFFELISGGKLGLFVERILQDLAEIDIGFNNLLDEVTALGDKPILATAYKSFGTFSELASTLGLFYGMLISIRSAAMAGEIVMNHFYNLAKK